MTKRLIDIILASFGIVLFFPLLCLVAVLIKLDSRGPVLFRQARVGRRFQPFFIYKFRTMVEGAHLQGTSLTVGEDRRITRVGRLLRRTKMDELPQLINVIKGDMSFVGPRPEMPQYVELFRDDYEEILKIRPGITDLASLKYQDEAVILGHAGNPESLYLQDILPEKIYLAKEYLKRSSLRFDLRLILKTLPKLWGCRASENLF